MRRLILALAIAGCGSEGDPPALPMTAQATTCAPRDDLYQIHFTRTSGTCTSPADSVQRVDSNPPVYDPGCGGTWNLSDDKCVETSEEMCTDDSGKRIFRSKMTWHADASSAKGTLYVEASAPDGRNCTAVFDVTAKRL